MMTRDELVNFVRGYVYAIVGLLVVASLIPEALGQIANISGVPLLSSSFVGVLLGASVILFILGSFLFI